MGAVNLDEHPYPTGLHRARVASITRLTVSCQKRGRRTRADDHGPGRAELVQEMQEESMGRGYHVKHPQPCSVPHLATPSSVCL